MKNTTLRRYVPGITLLALCTSGWLIDPVLFWAVYLAAWWFCTGLVMGGLSNVWIHDLTEGAWGDAIRAPALRLARALPLLALLFVPLLLDAGALYPWVADAARGAGRWSSEAARPEFKSAWLTPWFFGARSVMYIATWLVLERLSRRANRSRRFAAAALLIYWFSASLAAIDWLMSLMPLWYSTAFPPLVVTGQMLAGFAAATLAAAIDGRAPRPVFRDLGNLLLVYVLSWAYIAFTEYLIIWAENLPHEIGWYAARLHTGWYWVGWLLITCHFFLPLLVLLSRDAKEAPRIIATLAGALLVIHLIDVWWIVVPSVRPESAHVLWLGPLAASAVLALVWASLHRLPRAEGSHA